MLQESEISTRERNNVKKKKKYAKSGREAEKRQLGIPR